jgi:hypothetical protein
MQRRLKIDFPLGAVDSWNASADIKPPNTRNSRQNLMTLVITLLSEKFFT